MPTERVWAARRDEDSDTWITPPGTRRPPGKSGRVWILFAGPRGFTRDRVVRLPLPARLGDQVGWSLAISAGAAGRHDVWVGAPGLTVRGQPYAGVLYRVSVSGQGVPRLRDTLTGDSPVIGVGVHQDDRLGVVLAPVGHGVMVGIPDAPASGQALAGVVVRLRTDPTTGAVLRGQVINQDSPGMPDRAERGDHFGASIGAGGLVVGVPGERLHGSRAVGAVQLLRRAPAHRLVAGALLDGAVLGLPAPAAGTYNRIGIAVAAGRFGCGSGPAVAVVSSDSRGWGWVSVVPVAAGTCPTVTLSPSDLGLPAPVQQFDGWSTRLGVDRAGNAGDDRLLVGLGGVRDGDRPGRGQVVAWRGRVLGELVAIAGNGHYFGSTLSSGDVAGIYPP